MKGIEFTVVQGFKHKNGTTTMRTVKAYCHADEPRIVMPHPEDENRAMVLMIRGEFEVNEPYDAVVKKIEEARA